MEILNEGEVLILKFIRFVREKPLPERKRILAEFREQAEDKPEAVKKYVYDLVDYLNNI